MNKLFNYPTIEELTEFLLKCEKFNQTKLCEEWGLTTKTLYNILHGKAKSVTYTTYTKLIGLCNELFEKQKE